MTDPIALSGRQPRAVRSALAVLEEVVAAGPGVTAKEISAALKLPQATTYRLLNLLVGEEYLVRLPDLRGFALGRRAARLALPVVPPPPAAARAVVEHLRGMVRWGVHLASFRGGTLTLVDPDQDHPPTESAVLARYPHASALGRLLLADQADWRALSRDLRPLTAHTVTGSAELGERVAEVAATGLARQCGELNVDKGCLAVPVHDPATGALVAGLALCGPAARVAEPNEELVRLLREHADRLVPLLA
ncbi:helix-turn-helix domain-containing protein [Pseudonocardia sp. KRD-184]|uniref:Helix-turn-helix domain-containing protein n=1 Tax=Pseudonocardia oceani TaxID=2792013 RepID=A0ABS6U943_9PSEU|nr:IclR family transcriptional regulator C-terminal domain-containing protein [Pseudonocardia oceani]MBW0093367.1 helix-turn-helix domain-containing protein [Pseudonocardia oceani]MBW0099014.1 helix-turn-helix domain-containing protein [Pseudonocardia oceani]MBW0113344.1 helix-turn-helix domain-containing protein [Pseudonocardia oceani]MBW0121429.1 helix-turn-helix domain-containing protein [Pseudonocardia oceani]MBW0128753.1 helix-turn-helix domain-containing protein [Pseudonocardia oceani]